MNPAPGDGPDAAGDAVEIRGGVLDAILAHARDEAPNECCGLLLGAPARVEASHRARNELASPTRYRIRPEDHFAAVREARARGLDVIGAYHSHPSSPPHPSGADLEEAVAGAFLYLIAGYDASGRPAVRGWRLVGRNFAAVRLVTVP